MLLCTFSIEQGVSDVATSHTHPYIWFPSSVSLSISFFKLFCGRKRHVEQNMSGYGQETQSGIKLLHVPFFFAVMPIVHFPLW